MARPVRRFKQPESPSLQKIPQRGSRARPVKFRQPDPPVQKFRKIEGLRHYRQPPLPPSLPARSSVGLQDFGVVVVDAGLLHPLLVDDQDYAVEVSVVFGTYNRLPLLRRCVESVRRACAGLSYEIVVSDGGSTDGSFAWLAGQHDVVALHGDLSGAVRAYNAAASRARGRYILALNDDAELTAEAIRVSLDHFRDPQVGQVAMAYHENGEVKISTMLSVPYANFAVTRANIVRAVEKIAGGMWPTFYFTYGADVELSCWAYRLGYKVATTQSAVVVHQEYVDGLRSKNLREDRKRGQLHQRWASLDQLRFRGPLPAVSSSERSQLSIFEGGELPPARWPRIRSVDPVIGRPPPRTEPKRERVLHWHLWTDDDPQASMAASMRALGSAGHVRVDWTKLSASERDRKFIEAAAQVRPTIAFLQLQCGDAVSSQAIDAVRLDKKRDPSLVVCVWSGDVGPGKGPWEASGDAWQQEIAKHVDLMFFTGTGQVRIQRARGMSNAAYLQIGFDEDRYYPGADVDYGRRHSVVFIGHDYGHHFDSVPNCETFLRKEAVAKLRAISGFQAYGSGFGQRLAQIHVGDVYRSSTLAVSVSLTSSLERYTSDRMIRSMACGCPTLVKRFGDMEGLGLRDGENCIVWDTVDELVRRAREWLEPSRRPRLREIGRRGAQLMKSEHTWGVRVRELAAIVNAVRGQSRP